MSRNPRARWRPGDVVLDSTGVVWTRASEDDTARGLPWHKGAGSTLRDGHPHAPTGDHTDDAPALPLVLIVRAGQAVRRRAEDPTLEALAAQHGIHVDTVRARMRLGWTLEEALAAGPPMPELHAGFGEEKTVYGWSKDPRCVVALRTVQNRIARGWKVEEAITTKGRGK